MNRNNLISVIFLLLMLLFVGVSLRLFSDIEKEKQRNVIISDSLQAQLDSNIQLQRTRDSLITVLSALASSQNAITPAEDSSVRNIIQNLKTVSETSARLNNLPAYIQAGQLEREAFTALVNNDFKTALTLFTSIEKMSPSYHMAYEISNLLRKKEAQLSDPATQLYIKREIVANLSWKAPPDLLKRLQQQVKQPKLGADPAKVVTLMGTQPLGEFK